MLFRSATDANASPATGTATLTVNITGANDTPAPPTLNGGSAINANESATLAAATLGTLAATDAENGTLTYTLVAGSGAMYWAAQREDDRMLDSRLEDLARTVLSFAEHEITEILGEGRTEIDRLQDVDGQLVFADNVIYASGYKGQTAALTPQTGRPVWTHEVATNKFIVHPCPVDFSLKEFLTFDIRGLEQIGDLFKK